MKKLTYFPFITLLLSMLAMSFTAHAENTAHPSSPEWAVGKTVVNIGDEPDTTDDAMNTVETMKHNHTCHSLWAFNDKFHVSCDSGNDEYVVTFIPKPLPQAPKPAE